MPRSLHGGRHELGQNFLSHTPSIKTITDLVNATRGPILEIGAGDGALTRHLAALERPLMAIDIDEHRVKKLRRTLPNISVFHADALHFPMSTENIVGNIPFHLTTPILRRLLKQQQWNTAVLLTQWEVARKRAGVGGRTMMTAQHAPWFSFELQGRVPRWGFTPAPNVDGGILTVRRRSAPLLPSTEQRPYENFVREVFSGRGGKLERIVQSAAKLSRDTATEVVARANARDALPRDLTVDQWVTLWRTCRVERGTQRRHSAH